MSVTAQPEMLRADSVASDDRVGVDFDQRVIRGYAVAEQGRTKTPGRGEFDIEALQTIIRLGNASPNGIRIRFQHPGASDDGLGKFVGRAKNFRMDERDGHHLVRADAHVDRTAMEPSPEGGRPLGEYLMDLADSDPGAFQSSIVISREKLDQGRDDDGNRLPPLFRPKKLLASDFVDTGDAVHGDLFSIDALDDFMEGSERRIPTKLATAISQYADQLFPDAGREVIESRFNALRDRYLDRRFGAAEDLETDKESSMDQETKDALAETNKSIEALTKTTNDRLSALTEMFVEDRKERKAELSAQQRAEGINAACEMSTCAEKGEATKWIADESLSVDDVRKILFERQCKKFAPVGDDPEAEAFSVKPKKSDDEKYEKEFEEQAEELSKDGISKEDFIKFRRRQDGKAPREVAA